MEIPWIVTPRLKDLDFGSALLTEDIADLQEITISLEQNAKMNGLLFSNKR